jgi:hypothetical protein
MPKLKIGQHVWLVSSITRKSTSMPVTYTVDEYRVLSFDRETAVVVRYWDDEHPFQVVDICIRSIFVKVKELFFDVVSAQAHADHEKMMLGILPKLPL